MNHNVTLAFLIEESVMKAELWIKLHNLYELKRELETDIAETLEMIDGYAD